MTSFARKNPAFSSRLQAAISGGVLAAYAIVFMVFGVGSNLV